MASFFKDGSPSHFLGSSDPFWQKTFSFLVTLPPPPSWFLFSASSLLSFLPPLTSPFFRSLISFLLDHAILQSGPPSDRFFPPPPDSTSTPCHPVFFLEFLPAFPSGEVLIMFEERPGLLLVFFPPREGNFFPDFLMLSFVIFWWTA